MPLGRTSVEPTPIAADPRRARPSATPALREPKSEDASSAASVASAAGPRRPPAGLDKPARHSHTPYSRSHSSKPPTAQLPASIYAQDGSGLVFCGSCYRFQPPRTFADSQLWTARRTLDNAIRHRRELKLRDFPKCNECIAPQVLELKCSACGCRLPVRSFSEAMRANPHGATCRPCQSVAIQDQDVKPRADIEADPFAALSSDEELDPFDLDDDDLTSCSSAHGGSSRSSYKGAVLAAGQHAQVEDKAAGLDETYGVQRGDKAVEEGGFGLEAAEDEKPRAAQPAVVYDEDDEDW